MTAQDPALPAVASARTEPSFWASLMALPVRLVILAAALGLGLYWAGTPIGRQLAWALEYGAIVSMSLGISTWWLIFALNLVFGLAWVIISRLRPPGTAQNLWSTAEKGITAVNRQIGHVEALSVWCVLALVTHPSLAVQLPFLAFVLLIGEPIVNFVTTSPCLGGERIGPRDSERLHLVRRSRIYFFSIVGLLLLVLRAPSQGYKLIPLCFAGLAGIMFRYWRFRLRKKQERRGDRVVDARLPGIRWQLKGARWIDPLMGPGLVVGIILLVTILSVFGRNRLTALAAQERNGELPARTSCVPEVGGPVEAQIAVFMVADTQLHELGGGRFPGQMEIADTLVPVALRPVELDILSIAPLLQNRSLYQALSKERAASRLAPPFWAHLGDLADLACVGELSRVLNVLESFVQESPKGARDQAASGGVPGAPRTQQARLRLAAGIAPGNHDRAFTGNFAWSPYWDSACGQRAEKATSDRQIHQHLARTLPANAQTAIVNGSSLKLFGEEPSALVTVTPLGQVEHKKVQRGVIGIFYDTSDRHASDFGVAGVFGTFSEAQAKEILALTSAIKGTAGYDNPLFVLFGHHPFDDMTPSSRTRMLRLLAALDRGSSKLPQRSLDRRQASVPSRILALVTAHSHQATRVRHCLDGRRLKEFVVGSTLDPPQEAALLEIGTDVHGRAAVRVGTLPSVRRPELTCSDRGGPSAGRCRSIVTALADRPECRELFTRSDGAWTAGPACGTLERAPSFGERLTKLAVRGGPADPPTIRNLQTHRAHALLTCMCGGGQRCTVPDDPLRDEAYASLVTEVAASAEGLEEVTCLAWAASAVQAHKASGMEIADALRCAFDDPTLAAAQEGVASLEEVPCN